MKSKVVTRFAPSPTGFMHIGGVRTALFAWLWARKNKGIFILRIEDTDKEREVEGSIEHIMESLKWLGIEWDEGPDVSGPHKPYLQSERLDSYKKYAQVLIEKGYAYPDPYTKEELDVFRKKSETEKKLFLYRDYRPEKFGVWDGTKALRFKTPEIKSYKWNDAVRGELSAGVEALDDFILIKGDGYPTYNFAHIIDDLEMKVTHIIRADEFISSTPKFLSLYEALDITPPIFVTLPPILAEGGNKKLSKRDGAKDILEYGKEGYMPEAVMNFLALLGWNPGTPQEIFTEKELIETFDISRIQISGAQVNLDKLDWIQKEYIKKLTGPEFIKKSKLFIDPEIRILKNLTEKEFDNYILQFKEKITIFGELSKLMRHEITTTSNGENVADGEPMHTTKVTQKTIIISGPNDYLLSSRDPIIREVKLLIPKDLQSDMVAGHLRKAKSFIEKIDWEKITEKNDENDLWVYAGKEGRGKVLWPLRVALSGEEKSPDPFEIMKTIGKDSSLRRIENALEALQKGTGMNAQTTTTI